MLLKQKSFDSQVYIQENWKQIFIQKLVHGYSYHYHNSQKVEITQYCTSPDECLNKALGTCFQRYRYQLPPLSTPMLLYSLRGGVCIPSSSMGKPSDRFWPVEYCRCDIPGLFSPGSYLSSKRSHYLRPWCPHESHGEAMQKEICLLPHSSSTFPTISNEVQNGLRWTVLHGVSPGVYCLNKCAYSGCSISMESYII